MAVFSLRFDDRQRAEQGTPAFTGGTGLKPSVPGPPTDAGVRPADPASGD